MVHKHIRLLATVATLAISGLPAVMSSSHAADVSISPVAKPKAPAAPVVAKPKPAASEEEAADAPAETPYKKVIDVFTGDTTIAGEKVSFPVNDPGIKSLIVTMEPGEKTAWHQHGTPLYAIFWKGI